MNKINVTKILLFLLALAYLFIPIDTYTVLVGKNLISNESFENPPGFYGDNPRDWWSWNSVFNGITNEAHRMGSQSAFFSCPHQGEAEGMVFTYKAVKPGKEYVFSCYALNSARDPVKGNAFGQISIEWRKKKMGKDKDGKDIEVYEEISRSWGPTFGPELHALKWTFFSMTATAPAEADDCNFVIQFFNNGGSGKFFVDDVAAEEK